MTAQIMDKLIKDGKEYYMGSEPLEDYISNLAVKPDLVEISSACWRGYTASWEIIDKKLYLIDFLGQTSNFRTVNYEKQETLKYFEVGMDFIFPNQKSVFAEWFSGEIRLPMGKMLNYVHGGYNSTFEVDIFLEFKNGLLIGKRIVNNLEKIAEEMRIKELEIALKKNSFLTKIMNIWKKK